MTDLPPFPDGWEKAFATRDQRGGGVLTIGTLTWHVRNWRDLNAGQTAFELQPVRDAAWEAWLERSDKKVGA